MNVKVLFFANLKDIAGQASLEIEVEDGATVSDVKTIIVESFPKLKEVIEKIFISLNQEMAVKDDILKDGDEVGLLPPFSGG